MKGTFKKTTGCCVNLHKIAGPIATEAKLWFKKTFTVNPPLNPY